MLNIAICDDMPDQLEHLVDLTKNYIIQNQIDAEIHAFSHSDEMLTAAESLQFHIYIFDIIMPMMSGVELGVALRRLDRESQIIYATTAPEYALDSFAANPIGYLVKPVDKERFGELLTLALSKVKKEEKTVAVKTKDGLRVLNASLIVCCERLKNTVRFTMTTGETLESLSIRGSISNYLAPLLQNGRFLQPHISYVINMSRVERLTDKEFVMRGGAVIPISAKTLAAVRKTYLDFVFNKGVN